MKSALYLLAAFLPFRVLPIQVSTPAKAQNPRIEPHQDYDTDLYWEFNLDQDEAQYVDRCEIIQYENLNVQLTCGIIRSHLRAYDYGAALEAARSIRPFLNERTWKLLESAKMRLTLNWRALDYETKQMFGLSGSNHHRNDLAEQLLWLQLKQKRGDLSDFLRGLTPALFALLRVAVEEKCGYPLSKYCDRFEKLHRDRLEMDELGRRMLSMLENRGRKFDSAFLISAHYAAILVAEAIRAPWAQKLLTLRAIEEQLRNRVAHTITCVDEAWIRREQKSGTPMSSSEIMALLRGAVQDLNDDPDRPLKQKLLIRWDSYDRLNRELEQMLP